MRRDGLQRLREQQRETHGEMRSLLGAADAANRELTRDEQERFDALELEYRSRQTRIEKAEPIHAREQAEREREYRATERVGDKELIGLGRDELLSDWVAEHRSRRGLAADFEPEELENMSLGRMLRAKVTGDSSGLEQAEYRALAESADATGGGASSRTSAGRSRSASPPARGCAQPNSWRSVSSSGGSINTRSCTGCAR